MLFLITLAVISISNTTSATNNSDVKSGRLITIHDRGTEKVILSQSATVGDALAEAGIFLDSKDAVEPAVTEKLVALDYQINIYRARQVIIVDGNTRTKIMTPYQTAEQITQSVGIKLYDEDIATLGRTDDIIADGAGLQLTIKRATPFMFTLYGKTSIVRTQASDIFGMLVEKNIKLDDNDRTSLGFDTKISENLAVRIWREGKQTITVDEPVAFETEQIKDADRDVDYLSVKTVGQNGIRSVSYEVIIQDGQEVGRTEIASITTTQSTKQIEVVGSKGDYTTPSENENIAWDFLISNGFSRYQVAGIMGNLMQEHRFNTFDTVGGLGIAQWIGGRRTELLAMSHPENIYTQLNFLMHELSTNYVKVMDEIKLSSSVEDSMVIFQNKFERCGVCRQDQRMTYAYNILASH